MININNKKHIVLAGDSIFDNKPYVEQGDTVSDILKQKISLDHKLTLLAVDGHIASDVSKQLVNLPSDCTDLFISVGGNDALQHAYILENKVSTVAEAFELFTEIIINFKFNYLDMIESVIQRCGAIGCKNITICTIYKDVPNLGPLLQTALSLFNEAILELANNQQWNVIDLRIICNEETDYSFVSPIEPSREGGEKITDVIVKVLAQTNNDDTFSKVFT